jgi:hypothetical protein
LVFPLPFKSREMHALMDLAHAPVFGLFALALLDAIRYFRGKTRTTSVVVVWISVVAIGCAVEVVQEWTGRSPSWMDIEADALGATAFLIGAMLSGRRSQSFRLVGWIGIAMLLLMASIPPGSVLVDSLYQQSEFPILASFESDLELSRWSFDECRAERSGTFATRGESSLRLELGPGTYPGAAMVHPISDWSGYSRLEFDVYLDNEAPLDLIIKIQDEAAGKDYRDRFHQIEPLRPGSNTIRIDLTRVQLAPPNRLLDLTHIELFQLFSLRLDHAVTIYLDNIQLIRSLE